MIAVLGIPYDDASSYLKGPALAPSAIRQMESEGSSNQLSENGTAIRSDHAYTDLGDVHFKQRDPQSIFETIRDHVATALTTNEKILVFGGDHSVSYPVVDAVRQKYSNLHILHFDAHADLYDIFDDNPYSHACPFARIMESGRIASLTQVGIRTLDHHQREQAKRFGVRQIEMKTFSTDYIKDLKGPLYISLDLDVLDPAHAPGLSHYEPGGVTTRDLISMIQQITVPVIGADIVEYNPVRDINHMTAMVAYKLFKELIAKMISF